MSSSPTPPDRRKRRRLIWLLAIPVLALLALALAMRSRGRSGSEAIIERMRAAGYPTTLAELDRWYPAVPDAENAALAIVKAAGDLPTREESALPLVGSGRLPERGKAWDPDTVSDARRLLDSAREPLAGLMTAARLPHSRYPIVLTNVSTLVLPHLFRAKGAAQFLALKAAVEAEEGHAEAAASATAAVFAIGRSLDAEPFVISRLVHISIDGIGLAATERLLNRAGLPDSALTELQVALSRNLTNRGLERGFVGETFLGLEMFRTPPNELGKLVEELDSLGPSAPDPSLVHQALGTFYSASGLLAEDERFYLSMMEQLVVAAKATPWAAAETYAQIETEVGNAQARWYRGRMISSMVLPAFSKAHVKDSRNRTGLACGITAIAIERFRQAHAGELPDSLTGLTPAFLPEVPIDPFTGQPLHFVRREGGYIVYSFGPDKDDDGGKEFRSGVTKGDDYDVTFTIDR